VLDPTAPPSAISLLDGADATYARMLAAIAGARQHVHLEMYAFELDPVGDLFVAALAAAVTRGALVRVIVDGWGSLRHGQAVVSRLRATGCLADVHNAARQRLLGRLGCNHRKLLVVDGEVVFVGGINIGTCYTGWDDVAVEVRGPVCRSLALQLGQSSAAATDGRIHLLLTGFRAGWRLRKQYLQVIRQARRRLFIAHSYFLPDRGILRALRGACRRGVEVVLLLPHRSDVPLAVLGTRRVYRRLLRAGVQIHELADSILHAKVAVADGRDALVGSFNLDPLSLTNMEALARVQDREFAAALEQWIASRLPGALRITMADVPRSGWRRWLLDVVGLWVRRGAFWLARWIARR
jgi:cardiolipin synthase